jgi:hypothetical protein
VVIEQAPRFGIVGNAQILRFRVDDVGGGGEPIDVTVKLGTGTPQSLTVTPGVSAEVPITLDHGGPARVIWSIPRTSMPPARSRDASISS